MPQLNGLDILHLLIGRFEDTNVHTSSLGDQRDESALFLGQHF